MAFESSIKDTYTDERAYNNLLALMYELRRFIKSGKLGGGNDGRQILCPACRLALLQCVALQPYIV